MLSLSSRALVSRAAVRCVFVFVYALALVACSNRAPAEASGASSSTADASVADASQPAIARSVAPRLTRAAALADMLRASPLLRDRSLQGTLVSAYDGLAFQSEPVARATGWTPAGGLDLVARLPSTSRAALHLALESEPEFWVDVFPVRGADDATRAAVVEGALLIHEEAEREIDVVHVAEPHRVEQLRVLRSERAATAARYTLRVGPAVKSVRENGGRIELRDAAGRVRLQSEAPFAIDANGVRRAATVAFHGETGALEIALDVRGLAYPIVVDPSWTSAAFMSSARVGHGLVAVGTDAYAFGGYVVPNSATATLDRFNTSTSTWTPLTSVCTPNTTTCAVFGALTTPRINAAAVLLSTGRVLVFGGTDASSTPLSSYEIYDRSGPSASSPALAAAGRASPFLVTLSNGHVMTGGGGNFDPATAARTFLFNITSLSSGDLFGASMSPTVNETRAVRLSNGTVLAAGGIDATGTIIASAQVFALGPIGTACAVDTDCQLGHCADGFCCNAACTGQCESCSATPGTCAPVSGAPAGGRAACSGGSGACASKCNGVTTTSCQFPTNATSCGTSCVSAQFTASACNGSGSCTAGTPTTCAPYNCTASGCNTTCVGNAECAPGYGCSGGICVVAKAQSAPCTSSPQCLSGMCVDGYCCDKPCGSQCQACDLTGFVGFCSAVTGAPHGGRAACTAASADATCGPTSCSGSDVNACHAPTSSKSCGVASCAAGTQKNVGSCDGAGACTQSTVACGAYACSGATCRTTCGVDTDCASGNFCNVGVCVPKKPSGSAQTCAAAHECASGDCVDGYCCDTACTGTCQACSVGGKQGTCSFVLGAPVAGHGACTTDGSACGGTCGGASASCSYANTATSCAAAVCAAATETQTLVRSCDGAGRCAAGVATSCGRYVCGATSCKTTCALDADCATGSYCAGSTCTSKSANECASGFCADGVCCNAGCTGQCEACNGAGICSAIVGAPHAPRGGCASDGSSCNGACDGANRASCTYPTPGTTCAAATCIGGTATTARACDGAGTCNAGVASSCAPETCAATACKSGCTVDTDCIAGDFCAAGSCKPKLVAGAACSAASQCALGNCVDGVCCNGACGGQCQACDVAGSVGTCTNVPSGAPHAGRAGCTNVGGGCGGVCNGSSATSCAYPSSATQCRPASCNAATSVETMATTCDGAGTCPPASTVSCGAFTCNGPSCRTTCTSTATDCVAGQACNGGIRGAKIPNGLACTASSLCLSGLCVDGVCCNAACGGQCQACDLAGSRGVCTTVSSGVANRTCVQSGGGSGGCTVTRGVVAHAGDPGALAAVWTLGVLARRRRRSKHA